MIPCSSCGHENDDTRIFCQNCGIRLVKSEGSSETTESLEGASTEKEKAPLPKEPVKPKQSPMIKPHLSKSKNSPAQSPFKVSKALKSLVHLLFAGALTALLIQSVRAPSGVPEALPADAVASRKIMDILNEESSNPYPRVVTISQKNINTVLAYSLIGSPHPLFGDLVIFKRIFILLGDGEFDLVKEQNFLGIPLYLDIRFRQIGNQLDFESVGGQVGRLPLPASVSKYLADFFFGSVLQGFEPQLVPLKKARLIRIEPDKVTLDFPGEKP